MGQWPIILETVLRAAQDWEIESMELFFDELYAMQIRLNGSDKLVCAPSPMKGFQVKSYYCDSSKDCVLDDSTGNVFEILAYQLE